jgi:hypothetical protein
MDNSDDIAIVNKIITEASLLKQFFMKLTMNVNINQKCKIMMYLNHVEFALFVLPFLNVSDICSLRLTCKDMNYIVESVPGRVAYYYKNVKRKDDNEGNGFSNSSNDISNSNSKVQLKPLNELKNKNEVELQLKYLNDIKLYMRNDNCDITTLMNMYKVSNEYLNYEDKRQKGMISHLEETLTKSTNEYEKTKEENNEMINQYNNSNSNNRMSYSFNNNNRNSRISFANKSNDDIKKEIDILKLQKSKLLNEIAQYNKLNNELKLKNKNKINSIHNMIHYFNPNAKHETEYHNIKQLLEKSNPI